MRSLLTIEACLPEDRAHATLVGRIWSPQEGGPLLVAIAGDALVDLSSVAPTARDLFEMDDPLAAIRSASALPRVGSLAEALANSCERERDAGKPWFLAPCDLQAVKAAGVTFVESMLERVIEEQARGDPAKAESVRRAIVSVIGDDLKSVRPGSAQAAKLKDVLIAQHAWSQYLEVGIGPDAEIFTKSQPMSAVGLGADIGIHPKSRWNNPEPEIVLVVDSRGRALGATMGNDVNLRDFEGRSALLLGKAKDNNASCAIGPFIRLLDERFTMDAVRRCELAMRVEGPDGFVLEETSPMAKISRDPLDLVAHATGPTHQYPDGFVLFLGTMFAPTKDRLAPGQGFTHVVGDVVTIATPLLGALVNRVDTSDAIAPWTFGAGALMHYLARRGLLATPPSGNLFEGHGV
jgi:fumarylacetoacetate (FAA) hydrolase family protein